jgi:DNA-binding transcriptional LysR family regulator
MDQLDCYRAFVCVAECQSFTRAADRLGWSKAVVSTSVRQLEEQVGARLFHRTTRSVSLTQDGSAFYERCVSILHDFDELAASFQHQQKLSGRLRIDLPSRVARNLVVPKLPEFLRLHPELRLELSCTDRLVDVVSEGFDVVLRVGSLRDSNLIAKPLGQFAVLNVASPDYLAQHGTPKTLSDLPSHQLIHYAIGSNLSNADDGFEYFDGHQYQAIRMSGVITVNNTDAYEAACIAGFGIAQMPVVGARGLIEQGLLVEILPALRAAAMPVQLVYASRRHLSMRVRAMMDWLAQVMAPWLD